MDLSGMKKNNGFLFLYIGFIGITGIVLMLWITPLGSGVFPDSIIYIGAAKNILSGKGLSINGNTLTHYPPLYPLLLAATSLLDNNLVQAARLLNAIIFGINVGFFALAVYLSAGHNLFTATCAVFFFVSSAPILLLHSFALSEPLFIALSLACIVFLSMYVIRPTLYFLIFSSLFLGFAIATRYIGIAFLPVALFMVYAGGEGQHLSRRFRDSLLWVMLACAPLVIFIVRNMMMSGSAANRSIIFHPISMSSFAMDLISSVFVFIAPKPLPRVVSAAFVGLFAVFLIPQFLIFLKRSLRDINWRSIGFVMPVLCLLFSVSYMLFLLISIFFLDAATPVDTRLLSPIFLILTVGVFSAMWGVSKMPKKQTVWWCFLLFVVLSISIKTPDAIRSAVVIQKNGGGYSSRQWQYSESIAFVRLLGDDVRIYSNGVYSNGADALAFLTDKKSISIPFKKFILTALENPRYNEEIEAMCNEIKKNRALLVYLNNHERNYLPNKEELEAICQLPVLRRFADGTVYGISMEPRP